MTQIWQILRSLRPLQWIKNFALFASLIFSGLFFYAPGDGTPPYFFIVLYAVVIFSLVTSSVYLMNDVVDVKADRRHPFKKNRPVASGAISVKLAIGLAIGLLVLALVLSWPLPGGFTWLIVIYVILQLLYSFWLKKVPIFDVACIAASFILRVYAGAAVVNLHMNVWFLLTMISLALFLAIGKRQSELTLLGGEEAGATRKTLQHYSQVLLQQYTAIFAGATWLTYALFTFQYQYIKSASSLKIIFEDLPKFLQPEKVLMFTIPLVILGVMRYLQLIYEKREGEVPALVLIKDKMLLGIVIAFGLSVMVIIYGVDLVNLFLS